MNVKTASIAYGAITYPLLAVMLFGSAGTLHWLAGWTFFATFAAGCILLTWWLLVHDPGLVEERMRREKNQKGWDKVFLGLIYVFFTAWWVIMPLDAVRFGWSHVPLPLRALGVLVTFAGYAGVFYAMRANPFASAVVRIQEERGHTVVSTGPYRFVRHPMYGSALFLFVGVPLWLGSWCGLAVGLAFTALMGARAVMEERTLARELPGYADYAKRVRWRLVPYLW